jgi:leucyl aminopeptidase
VADIRNVAPIGIPDGLIAALFLHSFTGSVPWGHIDIAGTAWSTENAGWRTLGCSGFGARLLSELAGTFQR